MSFTGDIEFEKVSEFSGSSENNIIISTILVPVFSIWKFKISDSLTKMLSNKIESF